MKWLLCITLVFVLSVQSKPINHGALGPEVECLKQYMDIIQDIMKEVHSITPPDNEKVGEYVVCYLKKRQILGDNAKINADQIYKYWSEVYYTTISSDSEEKELRDAAAECAKLTAPNLPILGLKIKNCLLEGARRLPFVG